MGGFLVSPDFEPEVVDQETMNVASIMWGFCLAFSVFSGTKAARQTIAAYRRGTARSLYIFMIWGHWMANFLLAVLNWLYLWGSIQASFWLWFFILVIWVFQTQLIVQIIINRVALLMHDRRKVTFLKLGVLALISAINVSVFCIWIPTRLQVSDTYARVNNIWDRIEKCILLVVDVLLNGYFIWLVRSRLIKNGLTKYTRLFNWNVGMIAISIAMDVVLVGMMSLPNALIYIQFQSIAYLVKLHIEMNMAELIKKVVRATNPNNHKNSSDGPASSGGVKSSSGKTGPFTSHGKSGFLTSISRGPQPHHHGHGHGRDAHIELSSVDDLEGAARAGSAAAAASASSNPHGIHKTTVVTQTSAPADDKASDSSSISSAEQELRRHGL